MEASPAAAPLPTGVSPTTADSAGQGLSSKWRQYWTTHPRINFWHAQTILRREDPTACFPLPYDVMSPQENEISTFTVVGGGADPDVLGLLSFVSARDLVVTLGYHRRSRSCDLTLVSRGAAEAMKTELVRRNVGCGELHANSYGELRRTELVLRGAALKGLRTTSLESLFHIFGCSGVVITGAIDDMAGRHAKISFLRTGSAVFGGGATAAAEMAATDAAFALWQLQPLLARDWGLILTMAVGVPPPATPAAPIGSLAANAGRTFGGFGSAAQTPTAAVANNNHKNHNMNNMHNMNNGNSARHNGDNRSGHHRHGAPAEPTRLGSHLVVRPPERASGHFRPIEALGKRVVPRGTAGLPRFGAAAARARTHAAPAPATTTTTTTTMSDPPVVETTTSTRLTGWVPGPAATGNAASAAPPWGNSATVSGPSRAPFRLVTRTPPPEEKREDRVVDTWQPQANANNTAPAAVAAAPPANATLQRPPF